MIVGLWMTPALLVGLFAMLWVTTWLEPLVASPLPTGVGGMQARTAFLLAAASADSLGMPGAGSAPPSGVRPLTEGRSQPCTSE